MTFYTLHIIEQFIVCNFTSFSDHAPLHVRLRCILHDSQEPERNCTSNNSYNSYRWTEELKDYESLTLSSGSISQIVFSDIEKSQDGIDNYVESFTSNLMEIISPFFCNSHSSNNTCDRTRSKTTRYKEDKPWFNSECKRLRSIYISSLYTFNRDKNVKNHQILIMAKSKYKRLENKIKRKYQRQEGDMIAALRKSDPKKYYKLFQKKRAQTSDVSLSEFFEHFRNLVTNDGINETVDSLDTVSDTTYDELDQIITQDEILKRISNLKRVKETVSLNKLKCMNTRKLSITYISQVSSVIRGQDKSGDDSSNESNVKSGTDSECFLQPYHLVNVAEMRVQNSS
ncbi:unnamed protein product [Mytilus coruscus]|uniref:Uncharacterized protein n=1 Tax=Mytilus coruscus TaxID=42192 RepID=A0A6J8EAU9_MYTCO|nr:unnamed protein product [Mytilus coruscus]